MKKSLLILSLFALLGTGCNKTSSSTNEVSSSKAPISNTVSSSSKEESSSIEQSSSSIEQSSSSSESSKTPDIEFYNIKGTIKNVFSGNLEGVKVYANDVEVAVTNSDGKYEISNVAKADSYLLRFEKDGYASEEKEISVFTKKEQQVIESFCLNHKKRNYIGIVICLYTGIRLGELLALTWEDIDFNSNLLTINKTSYSAKVDGKTQIIVDKPKTKKSNRVIPLPNQLVKLFKIIKKESNSKYVITTRNSGMVGNRSYQRTFKFILKKVNVPYRNFHSLRHTFATNAIELGMDVKTLAEILGHTNAMITLNRYSHSLLSYKIEMMNKLGKNLILSIKNA